MGKIQKGKIVKKGTCECDGHEEIHTIRENPTSEVYDCLLTSPTGPQSAINMCDACIEISELCGFEIINSDSELVK